MGYGDKMTIGAYTLICRSYTDDDAPNFSSQWAVLDVYKGAKQVDTMTPVRRFYKARAARPQPCPTFAPHLMKISISFSRD